MKRKDNSQHKLFNLDKDVISLIEIGSDISNMSQSEFIEFLVNSWDENVNPIKKLKHLRSQKEVLNEDMKEIEREVNTIMDNVEKVEEWRKIKQERKPEIIENLVRVLSEGRHDDAETIAKNQGIRLGVPATQLIFEALDKIRKDRK